MTGGVSESTPMTLEFDGGREPLITALATAARAASHALEASRPEIQALLQMLHVFRGAVDASNVVVSQSQNENVQKAVDAFRANHEKLRAGLDEMLGRTEADLSKAFAEIERDAIFVTLMLFGRTRTGKSTTMEALTGGDGASIGTGRQHTTKEITYYYYPRAPGDGQPDTPALRIADTPGIEGFEGDELGEKAEQFIEQSDHILFLFSDDKEGAGELGQFDVIRTQGKGITVLLNIKANDEDLDILVADPSYIFKQQEIDGHVRRISGHMERQFGILPPPIIPFHARAAWLSKSPIELPAGIDRSILGKHSRLSDLEGRINSFIRQEARLARLKTPRDLLLGYIRPLKDELRPFAGAFRAIAENAEHVTRRLRTGANRARRRAGLRFPLLRARFQAVSDTVDSMVDEMIAAGKRGAALDARWQALLHDHEVSDAALWFIEAGQRDFRQEIQIEVEAAAFDYTFSRADDVDEDLGGYYEAESNEKKNKYVRVGIRGVGGATAGALAAWAITNWWNPTGWAAAAGAALAVGVGLIGEAVAHKISNEWEHASKRELYEKRSDIIKKFKDGLWQDHRAVRAYCDEWLDQAEDAQARVIDEVAKPIRDASRQLWQVTVDGLSGVDEITDRVNEGLVSDLFAAVVPACTNGAVAVVAVTREAGYRTKVMVSSTRGGLNAVAACVGYKGVHIQRIREVLGDHKIDLIDEGEPPEFRVLQALGLQGQTTASVSMFRREGRLVARVRVASSTLLRAAVGPRGHNLRLANKLTGINIIVAET